MGIVTGAGPRFQRGRRLRSAPAQSKGTFWEIPSYNSLESGMEIWKPTNAASTDTRLGSR